MEKLSARERERCIHFPKRVSSILNVCLLFFHFTFEQFGELACSFAQGKEEEISAHPIDLQQWASKFLPLSHFLHRV